MSNDFQLTPDPDGELPAVDPDVAVVMAFLAGELTPVQNLAVEARFTTDDAFRDTAMPIMEGWFVPRSFAPATAPAPILEVLPGRDIAATGTGSSRRVRITRIAAAIGLVVLPAIGLAQAVAYSASHPTAPGHLLAQRLLGALGTGRSQPAQRSVTLDGPVAVTLTAPHVVAAGIPPTRRIGTPIALSVDSFAAYSQLTLRPLSDGRVIVVDRDRRRAGLYDAKLMLSTRLDVSDDRWNGAIGVTAYRGDSTLLISGGNPPAVQVLDASGRAARALEWADPTLVLALMNRAGVVTPSGDIVGKIPRGLRTLPSGGNWTWLPSVAGTRETTLVVRGAAGSFRFDTVAYVGRQLAAPEQTVALAPGATRPISRSQPADGGDAMALFADGSMAIIRSDDYHIDWVAADGTRRSTPPVPHDTTPLSERDRLGIVLDARAMAARFPVGFWATRNGNRVYRVQQAGIRSDIGAARPPFITGLTPLPYRPLADANGRLWIPLLPVPGGGATPSVVFDIVDKRGELIDRVQMPPATTPIAFAPGIVFAMQWLGAPAGCVFPAPGLIADVEAVCMPTLARLAAFRIP